MGDFDETRASTGIITPPTFEPYTPSSKAEDADKLRALLEPAFKAAQAKGGDDTSQKDKPLIGQMKIFDVPDGSREEDGHVMQVVLIYDHKALSNAIKLGKLDFHQVLADALNKQLDADKSSEGYRMAVQPRQCRPGQLVFNFPGTLDELTGETAEVTQKRAQATAQEVGDKVANHRYTSLPTTKDSPREL